MSKNLSLFQAPSLSSPLADRLRPRALSEFVGQEHLLAPGKPLRKAIEEGNIQSLIFWGPPGTGKTTLAYIIANTIDCQFIPFSAVTSGIKEIKEVMQQAEASQKFYHQKTLLFVDELHRFNKAQQDAFLPYIEKGIIILIGATTENPSFEVISPLLSRAKVYSLNPLTPKELSVILQRALEDKERGLGKIKVKLEASARDYLFSIASGDARVMLNTLEFAVSTAEPKKNGERVITREFCQEVVQKKVALYDKAGEEHYNIISAFIKSLRGSAPDAALYWLFRMLESGEDPLYIARRMVILASEDIGNADPQALQMAVAAKEAFEFVGLPEGELILAQAAIYLACAPKSNAVLEALHKAKSDVKEKPHEPVPLHIRNAPTKLMKDEGYGKGYQYPHNYKNGYVAQEYFPPSLKGRTYYYPRERGFEKILKARLEKWRKGAR
jgi:putative ATPase